MKKQIPGLNGLRALSIFIVIFSHLNIRNYHGQLVPGTQFLDGQFGVTIFFVLSGFLITTLLLNEESRLGEISLRDFYLKRIIRIFPVYFVLLAVYNILQLTHVLHFSSISWLTAITYTKDFNWNTDWEMAHLWSLSVEEQFYLFWPLVFLFAGKRRVRFAFFVVILSPICRMIGARYEHAGFDMYSIFQRSDALMWGCIFAIYHSRILAFIQRMVSINRLMLLLPFVLLIAVDQFTQLNHIYNWHLGMLIVPFGNLTGTIACVLIATIIVITGHYSDTVPGKFLNTKVMNYIGTLSYSLYIWQQLFFSHKIGIFSSWPLNIVMIFLAANVSYYFIEKPFLGLKNRMPKRGPYPGPTEGPQEGHLTEADNDVYQPNIFDQICATNLRYDPLLLQKIAHGYDD